MISKPETISPFSPPQRLLMGPGPSNIHPRVLAAMSRPAVGHLDPAFMAMMDEIKGLLRYGLQTQNELTFPVSGPGSAGMETCVVNLVSPGDKVIVCCNGVFGGRLAEIARRVGGEVITVEDAWGQPIDSDKLEQALKSHPDASLVAMVHAETSTGARSDIAGLSRLARAHGCLTLVDAVTSFGGIPLLVDEWGIDAVYTGTQKCLSAPPGLSPVSFSSRAVDHVRQRKHPVPSWFFDIGQVMTYWGSGAERAYHHTAPVNMLYGLHEALLLLAEEGLENAWARHADCHEYFKGELLPLGLSLVVPEPWQLPMLNTLAIPAGVDDGRVRRQLLASDNLEIGAGLGPLKGQVWRVGLMGHSCSRANAALCVSALARELGSQQSADSGIQAITEPLTA